MLHELQFTLFITTNERILLVGSCRIHEWMFGIVYIQFATSKEREKSIFFFSFLFFLTNFTNKQYIHHSLCRQQYKHKPRSLIFYAIFLLFFRRFFGEDATTDEDGTIVLPTVAFALSCSFVGGTSDSVESIDKERARFRCFWSLTATASLSSFSCEHLSSTSRTGDAAADDDEEAFGVETTRLEEEEDTLTVVDRMGNDSARNRFFGLRFTGGFGIVLACCYIRKESLESSGFINMKTYQ